MTGSTEATRQSSANDTNVLRTLLVIKYSEANTMQVIITMYCTIQLCLSVHWWSPTPCSCRTPPPFPVNRQISILTLDCLSLVVLNTKINFCGPTALTKTTQHENWQSGHEYCTHCVLTRYITYENSIQLENAISGTLCYSSRYSVPCAYWLSSSPTDSPTTLTLQLHWYHPTDSTLLVQLTPRLWYLTSPLVPEP